MLEREYALFNTKRDEFVRDHGNEFVVIQGESILGFFKDEIKALESMKGHRLGTFLVQRCVSIDTETAKYASRVAFA
ncbi:MAG: hypothetical protein A2Y38_22670 [Spirochaetes bacterium GWB1_59_5]|nr:MAG: hypothetical protein A2Y38_22670 [Spirochaetes bacterium GWB1_59_5]